MRGHHALITKFGTFEHALAERYRFEEELGRGAMGIVYRATDVRLGRPVAIKLLHPTLTNELGVARFQSEIRIAAGLHHPNIVGVHDSGESDGRLYYVMDYLGGETLRARLKREKQLSVEDALAIVDQVALGLQHAHDHGIVHRDVKPENIILAEGQARVLDFGLARALSDVDTDRLTASGLAVGTPHYLSPEQASAEKDVGPKADQYALACVLYEMLVGEPPFTGPTASSIAMRHISEQAAPLRLRRSSTPAGVEAAVRRAMEKVPADRFSTIAAFAAAGHAAPVRTNDDTTRRPSRVSPGQWNALITVGIVTAAILLLLPLLSSSNMSFGWPSAEARVTAARQAVVDGQLASAVRSLRVPAASAQQNTQRKLWLAQALFMSGDDSTAEWRSAAMGALDGVASLPAADTLLAMGLGHLASGRYDVACPALRVLRQQSPDPVNTFDLAECLARDASVILDSTSASGWRYRSRPAEALELYGDLLRQLPLGHEGRLTALQHIPAQLTTEWGQYRKGAAFDDSSRQFGAFPTVVRGANGTEVAYEPHPLSDFRTGQPWMNPPTLDQAIELNRTALRRVGASLVQENPAAAVSHETFSRALELGGELYSTDTATPSALSEIIAARRLKPANELELGPRMAEVRILVKLGRYAAARVKADSAISRWSIAGAKPTGIIENLLALTGRVSRLRKVVGSQAANYTERMPGGRRFRPAPSLGEAALEFSVEAKLGGSRDTLAGMLARLERLLDSYAARKARDSVRIALLARSLVSAVPTLGPAIVLGLPAVASIIPAQQAFARNDRRTTLTILDSLRQIRGNHPAAGTRLDQVYQEAWLRVAIADTTGAIAELDGALNGLPALGTLFLGTISESAAVSQAMRLRSSLAERRRDSAGAERWRGAAEALAGSRLASGSMQ
jgi:serine/threonine protein kinase